MSRWLEKQEELIAEEAESLGVNVEQPVLDVQLPHRWKNGDYYEWERGDSLHDIALAMGVTRQRLMDFNEIEEYQELETGIHIYYPAAVPDTSRSITVEVLPEAVEMHISKPGGTSKWSFGNIKTWDDARPSGFWPENTNVKISAIARVPIEDKDDPEATAAYYLEYPALGDYATTGRLRYTIGYAWSHLTEGHVDNIVVQTRPAEEAIAEQEIEPEPKNIVQPRVPRFLPGFTPEFIEQRLEDYKRDGTMHKFTETYQKLNPTITCMAVLPDNDPIGQIDITSGDRYILYRDFAMKRQNRKLFDVEEIEIGATFEYNGELYGRPVDSVSENSFFGIPMAILEAQDKVLVYNKPIDAAARSQRGGSLSVDEKYFWVPLGKILKKLSPKYIKKIENKKINKE